MLSDRREEWREDSWAEESRVKVLGGDEVVVFWGLNGSSRGIKRIFLVINI